MRGPSGALVQLAELRPRRPTAPAHDLQIERNSGRTAHDVQTKRIAPWALGSGRVSRRSNGVPILGTGRNLNGSICRSGPTCVAGIGLICGPKLQRVAALRFKLPQHIGAELRNFLPVLGRKGGTGARSFLLDSGTKSTGLHVAPRGIIGFPNLISLPTATREGGWSDSAPPSSAARAG
jgi:hypothetical protein